MSLWNDGWITLAFMVIIYFLPAITAYNRRHRQCAAIIVLNIGMTLMLFVSPFLVLLAWFFALVWACTNNVARQPYERNV